MQTRTILSFLITALLLAPAKSETFEFDIVIYGGTSAGVVAAIQADSMGHTVALIEPSDRLGGLTSGGLGQTDIGNKAAIGGLSREFYRRVRNHYAQPSAWKWQASDEYRSGGQSSTSVTEETMWTFEPSVAKNIYDQWIQRTSIKTLKQERLDRSKGGVMTSGSPPRITQIKLESGLQIRGKAFIDCTYEGDLMAAAGVSYTIGREANATYGETLNGVQVGKAIHHQLVSGVDPYVVQGDPTSGLLPHIDPTGPGIQGQADHRVQAYCFRMCMTDHPENRIPFHRPEGYVEQWYELLLRNFEAGEKRVPWHIGHMPNRKTDANNNFGFSTDFIGQNYDYPDASYEQREAIVAEHRLYQQGLCWTLANHPRVPESVRQHVSRWGMCKDEFADGSGWQDQLYIREARRMVSDYVMTQHHCQGRETADDPIGLAAYTMDSHHQQRYVGSDGKAHNEGDVQVGGFSPYPISYRSIIPKPNQCSNLLVPVCLSASHIAFGSIRMEPVFMVLGQSAATAASLSINNNCSVQQVPYQELAARLTQDRQILAWTGPKPSPPRPGLRPENLAGIVIDEQKASRQGFEQSGTTVYPYVLEGYLHDGDANKGAQHATFEFMVPRAGQYEVRIGYTAHSNRATNVPVTIQHAAGSNTITINQKKPPVIEGLFQPIGIYQFLTGSTYTVKITNEGTDGYVILDAIQIVPSQNES